MDCGCFHRMISIECVDTLYQKALERFKDAWNVVTMKGISWQVLEILLPHFPGKCIFWLDAHLPGADYGIHTWDNEKNLDIRMPLIKELEVIKELRNGEDIILIDDLRFYKKDDFQNGNLEDKFMVDGYDKIISMFQETHTIIKHLNDDGYLELIPKRGL